MTAGTAVCNCDQPDTCLCLVEVKANGQTYTYEQKGRKLPPIINLHDKDGKGVDVGIKITPKGCVDNKGELCPSGNVYWHENGKADVTHKVPHTTEQPLNLKYTYLPNAKVTLQNQYNAVTIISLLFKDLINGVSNTTYSFAVNECKGKPLMNTQLFYNGVSLQIGPYLSSFTRFVVYPKYSVKVGVMIGLKSAVDSLTDVQRKELMLAHKLSTYNYNNHHGWQDKTSSQSIIRTLTITGFTEYTCGSQVNIRAESDKLVKEFTQYKNKLTFLNKAETALDTASKLFAAPAKTNKKVKAYPIGELSCLPPALFITGEGNLALDKTTNQPIMQGKFDFTLKPLIGIQFTIDLIQAFAAQYGLTYIIGNARAIAESGKDRIKQGKNGAYISGSLKLLVKGNVDVGFAVSWDMKAERNYQITDKNEAKLTISGIINVDAGGKIYFVKGYFQAEGSITAEGCCGLEARKATEKDDKKGLDVVFYHNGIKAKIKAEAGFGEFKEKSDSSKSTTKANNKGTVTGKSKSTISENYKTSGKVEETWTISEGLKKKDSKYRFKLT